jgi:hypothetical protein
MLSPTRSTFGREVALRGCGREVAQKGPQSQVWSQHVLQCEHGWAQVGHKEHAPLQRPAQHCSPPEVHWLLGENGVVVKEGWLAGAARAATAATAAMAAASKRVRGIMILYPIAVSPVCTSV